MKSNRLTCLGLIFLSIAARTAIISRHAERLADDIDGYLLLARPLAQAHVFGDHPRDPTAFRPPLYPLLIAPLFWLQDDLNGIGISLLALLHVVWGAGTTLLTWHAGRRLGLGMRATVAGGLVAIDPLLVYQSSVPMTETLAALLFAGSICVMIESRGEWKSAWTGLAGLLLGLGALCRTTMLAYAVAAAVAGGFAGGVAGTRIRWKWAALVLGMVLAVQVPWAVRNWHALGRPILTTTHGGYTLLLANNDVFYDEVIDAGWDRAWPEASLEAWQARMQREWLASALRDRVQVDPKYAGINDELSYDAFCYRRAWETIAARPLDFLRSVAYRVISFWRPLPHAGVYSSWVRLACAVFYIPELALAAVALFRRDSWRWPWVVLPAALAAFTLVHSIYWSDMRMRAPIMPAVALLAAAALPRRTGSRIRRH